MTTITDPISSLLPTNDHFIHILVGPFVTKACSSNTPSSDIDKFLRDKNLGQSVTDCLLTGNDDVLTDYDTKSRLFSNTYFLVRTPLHKNVWIFQIFPPDPPPNSPLSPFLFSFKYRFFSKKQEVFTVLVWNRENVVTLCCAHPLLQLKPIQKISSFLLRYWKKTHPHLRIHSFFIPSMTKKNSPPTPVLQPNIFHLQDPPDSQDPPDLIHIDDLDLKTATTTVTPFPPIPTVESTTLPSTVETSTSTIRSTVNRKKKYINRRPFTLIFFFYLFLIFLILLITGLGFYYYRRYRRYCRYQEPSSEDRSISRPPSRAISKSPAEESSPKRFEDGVRGRKPRIFHNNEEFVNHKQREHQRNHDNRDADRIKHRRLKR